MSLITQKFFSFTIYTYEYHGHFPMEFINISYLEYLHSDAIRLRLFSLLLLQRRLIMHASAFLYRVLTVLINCSLVCIKSVLITVVHIISGNNGSLIIENDPKTPTINVTDQKFIYSSLHFYFYKIQWHSVIENGSQS